MAPPNKFFISVLSCVSRVLSVLKCCKMILVKVLSTGMSFGLSPSFQCLMLIDFRRIGGISKRSMNKQMKALNQFQEQGHRVMAVIAVNDLWVPSQQPHRRCNLVYLSLGNPQGWRCQSPQVFNTFSFWGTPRVRQVQFFTGGLDYLKRNIRWWHLSFFV